ncbi:MAG: riboflavin kinase/FMN adenylyltransferase [Candidatus Endobugula sp.]|jgi:riboflavin kinase/FMN adenylyltransferase
MHSHEFLRGLHNVQPEHRGNVVTIGAFDGVHLGHRAILQQVVDQARKWQLPSLVMIFEPQPHEFFSGEKAPARLMRLREKIEALFVAGVDRVLCLPFNQWLSQLPADEFIQHILVERLGTQSLVIGDDFCFGRGRQGNYALLQSAGQKAGFAVTDTATYLVDGERVSSTRIRRALELAEFNHVLALLGKNYTISGRVVKGQQLGRQLGAPTANVHLHRYRSPLAGVFVVSTTLENGEVLPGVANVGVRPTVSGDTKPILEVHLFDRNDDLYGQMIVVQFVHKIREEKCFDGVDSLRQQIRKDIQQARQWVITAA